MSLFTPWSGLAGGGLIGLAAGTLLLGNGDIMGASGIVSSVIISPRATFKDSSTKWKILFVSSFIVTASLFSRFTKTPDFIKDQKSIIGAQKDLVPVVSNLGYVVAGLLVGFGTKLGNGCTSGHGICGLARFSKRSLAAVMTFMSTGILAASVVSSDGFLSQYLRVANTEANVEKIFPTDDSKYTAGLLAAVSVAASIPVLLSNCMKKRYTKVSAEEKDQSESIEKNNERKKPVAIVAASLFSVGLEVSGMTKEYKIFNFLDLKGFKYNTWDATLTCVLGGGLVLSTLAYHFVKDYDKIIKNRKTFKAPIFHDASCGKFNIPTSTVIDKQLIIGSAMFGIGWGIGGLCPGPALYLVSAGYPQVMYYWGPASVIGSYLGNEAKKFL